jgi:hypothetical protein
MPHDPSGDGPGPMLPSAEAINAIAAEVSRHADLARELTAPRGAPDVGRAMARLRQAAALIVERVG